MALVSSPYGVQPVSDMAGIVRPLRIPFGIANNLGSNIFKNQPVKMVVASGTIAPVAATSDPIWGIFAGCEYTPLGGRPGEFTMWASGANYDPNYDMFVYVWPAWNPNTRVKVQADGSVAQAKLGSSFNLTNLTAGNTTTGLSQCTVGAAGVAAASQGQLTLMEFDTDVNSAVGDAYTDLICMIALPQIGPAPQASIG